MNTLTAIYISPHAWLIDMSNTDALIENELLGETDAIGHRISIRGDLPDQAYNDTLIHEILHAIIATSGLNARLDDEEDVVSTITPYLLGIMHTLPGLLR